MAHILVVDDIQDAADAVAELLTLFGHEVTVAYSGGEALDAMGERVPDVVLSDLGMPGMDGYRLAREIRSRWGTDIRLVAHSAHDRAAVVHDVARAGFDAFVSKAARPLELALALQGRRGVPDLRAEQRDRRTSNRPGPARRRSRHSHHEARASLPRL